MAAPRFAPVVPVEPVRAYGSPDHVPAPWQPGRPGEIDGRQPAGERLGYQGPDQGYVIKLAEHVRPHVRVTEGENIDDALSGCSLIALRRASMYGRAPVIHDLRIALAMWGFLSDSPPPEQVQVRRELFAGLRNPAHHYAQSRRVADMVPDATLRLAPDQVATRAQSEWRALTGWAS